MSNGLIERARKMASTGGMRDITIRALADLAEQQASDLEAANASILKLRAEVVEQGEELARIEGAALAVTLQPIDGRQRCAPDGESFNSVLADRATLLDAVRVLTAERDQERGYRQCMQAGSGEHRSERAAARAEVDQLRESNRQLAENAQIATDSLLRRTQELAAAEEVLRCKTAEADNLRKNRDALARGEAEALKMMDAEKQRADRLAAEVERYSQRELAYTHIDPPAEKLPAPLACPNCDRRDSWCEFLGDSGLMRCEKHSGGCGYSMSLDANEPENLRQARDLLRHEKTEANATILRLRAEATEQRELAEVLARGVMAYRRHWDLEFKETARDVLAWEDEHGHLVPR